MSCPPPAQSPGGRHSWASWKAHLSRHLHRLADFSAHAAVAPVVAGVVALFLGALAVADDPTAWQVAFATAASAVTLVMVFVIQHTQTRQQAAIQLKLDEIIRAMPDADDRLIHVEISPEHELVELDEHHTAQHGSLRP